MQTDNHSVREVFLALCKSVDTPIALGAWLRFEYNQTELARMDISPCDYMSLDAFKMDYLVVSFLSKWKGLNTGIDVEEVAIQKLATSEVQCRETNNRLKNLLSTANPWLHAVHHGAQRKIAGLLGRFSMFCIRDAYGWGPGATLDLPRRRAFLDTKLNELPITVSRSARSSLRNEIELDLHWSSVILGVVPEGQFCLLDNVFVLADECRITTVPKNAKTNRVIAIEPRGNAFLQKGVGGYIRNRLRRVGIDLDDQKTNQTLAKLALERRLATIDLSAASDSVSVELVWALLPYEWASVMDAFRSRYGILPSGERIRLEKFSSMGNGFTFELETLIFWAICESVRDLSGENEGVVAVYGDDIIVDQSRARATVEALSFFGFSVNETKSFLDGRFFESCGRHYFDGVDVTPAYQKEELLGSREVVRLGNRLLRLSFRVSEGLGLDRRLRSAWLAARSLLPASHRWAIPFGTEGDDGWVLPYSEFPFRFGSNHHGVRCRVMTQEVSSFPADDEALLAWSFRRGVVTDVPFGGCLTRTLEGSQPSDGFRRVIPDWRFSARWV